MFDEKRYVTKGINEKIPEYLQNLLWFMVETMDTTKKDFLQVFELQDTLEDGIPMQKIIHSQEQPPYHKEHILSTRKPVNAKVYIIDIGTYSTMILPEEY